MAGELSAAPALSTPADHLFEHVEPESTDNEGQSHQRTEEELRDIYEIARTAREVRNGGWKRIGLQFPDHMLKDAPRVAEALNAELNALAKGEASSGLDAPAAESTTTTNGWSQKQAQKRERIYILADTSYSACCVDEIAAEHVDADVVVHYGRSCLSPTSRLPVIYVFTQHILDINATLEAFEKEYLDKSEKVVLMADVTYQDHIQGLAKELRGRGCENLFSTEIIHDPTGRIPNRKVVDAEGSEIAGVELKEYSIFHISTPPTALLLALSSRVKSLYIHATSPSAGAATNTARLLGRRYARLLTLASAGIIGILVNTLSVSNYLESIASIRKQIADAGKKSYTVVVGKLNPAKLANFAEIDGWVVVGCWESSLVEDDAGFYRPVITPFELDVALQGDENRLWTGEWWGGIESVKKIADQETKTVENGVGGVEVGEEVTPDGKPNGDAGVDEDNDEESAPPEFDLRTGKLISHSRPMRAGVGSRKQDANGGDTGAKAGPSSSGALAVRSKGEVAMVNGVVSPGAEYLRSQRTWQGLGSDYVAEESAAIEEGRSGVARGYTVGEDAEKR